MAQRTASELQLARSIADILDDKFVVPGTKYRFGLDPILGLFPLVGDGASLVLSILVVVAATRNGIRFSTLLKMTGNIVLDFAVGSIPVLGTFFDFGYKANRKNLQLLETDYASEVPKKPALLMVAWMLFLILGILLLSISGLIALGIYIVQQL